jgi:ABC-2 type transport system ATP-binding protein
VAPAPVIEAQELTKVARGRRILDAVSLAINPGEVVGIVGPNGAGKTTLIRVITGLALPTSGTIRCSGDGPGADMVLGLVPEAPGFVEHLSGLRNLRLLASIRNRVGEAEAAAAMEACGLDATDRKHVSKYSLGMRQRLALAQALMEGPSVLIFDEPTNGLDVVGIAQLRRMIRGQAERGVGVLLASHLLTEVELACDRVCMFRDGRIVRELRMRDIRRLAGGVRVTVSSRADLAKIGTSFDVRSLDDEDLPSALLRTDRGVPDLARELVTLGVRIEAIGPAVVSLEELFLSAVGAEL